MIFQAKKQTNKFDFTTSMIPQVDFFLFVSLEETEDTKNIFQGFS